VEYQAFGGADPASTAWGREHAYGVTDWAIEVTSSDDAPHDLGQVTEPLPTDPNEAYVASLSDVDRTSYMRSFTGGHVSSSETEDPAHPTQAPPLTEQGCLGRARLAVYGDDPYATDLAFRARVDDFREHWPQDPRFVAAIEQWRVCLHDELRVAGATGVRTIVPDGVRGLVVDRAFAEMGLHHQVTASPAAPDLDVVQAVGLPDGRESRWIGTPTPLSAVAVADLREFEKRLWETDFACRATAALRSIQVQIESEFVASLVTDFPTTTVGAA
jgi:hypothetical protein